MRRRERTQAEEGLCPNGHEEARVLEAGRVRHAGAPRTSESYDRNLARLSEYAVEVKEKAGRTEKSSLREVFKTRCARLGDAAPGHALEPVRRPSPR